MRGRPSIVPAVSPPPATAGDSGGGAERDCLRSIRGFARTAGGTRTAGVDVVTAGRQGPISGVGTGNRRGFGSDRNRGPWTTGRCPGSRARPRPGGGPRPGRRTTGRVGPAV